MQQNPWSKDWTKRDGNRLADKLILGHVNINLLRNKFVYLKITIGRNIDIFLISKTKLDDLFSTAQFKIDECNAPFRFDGNSNDGEVLTYIVEDILSLGFFWKSQHYIETISAKIK